MSPRRVLMIAHHFPPAGGSGANRALAFARYLSDYGWEPVVLTPQPDWATNRDDHLLTQLPPSIRVVRTRSFEPRPAGLPSRPGPLESRIRPAQALRSHLGHLKRFPDAHLGWLPFALAAARHRDFDVIYSSSGPFTSHLVGLILQRTRRRPWVAELRDGWYLWNRAIFPDYPPWRNLLERRLESAAIRSADRVVLVTERMATAFRRQYPDLTADRFRVVSNGFDPAQLATSAPIEQAHRWTVLHAGALYYGRSLAAFLEAARQLVRDDLEFAMHFRLRLMGTLDRRARTELDRSGLDQHLEVMGQVGHAAALEAMRSASALLLVANTTRRAEATVPGKLFEYLASGRPILAVAPADSATTDVLSQTGGAWLAPAGDPAAITAVLRRAFAAHRAGQQLAPDPAQLARYDRRTLAGDLACLFDEVSAGAPRRI